jgi:hypothetical protein
VGGNAPFMTTQEFLAALADGLKAAVAGS